ncbi:MAG: GntR family transcriptional regulator [Hyphomicrobiales bacterium]|nr:GntR family transcriptional regulator [Hyphomicrobiales bacterium]
MDNHAGLRTNAGKLYVQIATLMRQRITSGQWPADSRVPTLEELAREFQVAVVTVRQAVSILEDEGLVWRRQGKGTFVTDSIKNRHWIRLSTDWSSMIRVWAASRPRILHEEPSVGIPALMPGEGNPAPAYRYLRRVHVAKGTPYALINIYLDRRVWELAPERFDKQMVIPLLQELPQVRIAKARQTITIGTADLESARLLEIGVGTPVGEVRRIIQDPEGTVTYLGEVVYRGDLVMLETDNPLGLDEKRDAPPRHG